MPSRNPFLPDDTAQNDRAFVVQGADTSVEPAQNPQNWQSDDRNAAANLVRQRVAAAYGEEPSAEQEIEKVSELKGTPSKHQQFLLSLQQTATSVAEVQTKWHEYYTSLPEAEKHDVWREFYQDQAKNSRYAQFAGQVAATNQLPAKPATAPQQRRITKNGAVVATHNSRSRVRLRDARSAKEIKEGIQHKISAGGKLEKKHHLQSLLFGLSMGALSLLIVLFGLFNEMIIAPFIQPSRSVSATPMIASNEALIGDGSPRVIIPKINVEIPVDYNVPSMQESAIQAALDHGVVHYPSTVKPGEKGNAAIFGHSSNNIFNSGKYKFAFVLLSKLTEGDIFYLTYNNQVYAYRVFQTKVVNPDELWVLNPVQGKSATAALITCDPPGTTLYRLVVWGEQISPDPATATAAASPQQIQSNDSAGELAGAPEPFWRKVLSWINPFD